MTKRFQWKWDEIFEPTHDSKIIALPIDYCTDKAMVMSKIVYQRGSILKFLFDGLYTGVNDSKRVKRSLHTFSLRSYGIFHKSEQIEEYNFPGVIPLVEGSWDLSKNPTNEEYHDLFTQEPKYKSDNLWVTFWGDLYIRTIDTPFLTKQWRRVTEPLGSSWDFSGGFISEESILEYDVYTQIKQTAQYK